MQESTGSSPLNWDDLRYVVALAQAGSLAQAARLLGVDHSTVGRRVESAERCLGLRLFLRSSSGFRLSQEGERMLGPLRAVEAAVLGVARAANQRADALTGPVRITSPETFGLSYLAPRLAEFSRMNPGLTVELSPSGQVMDLARGEAEVALRFFRSKAQKLVVKPVATVGYGLYGSPAYLRVHPHTGPAGLAAHCLLRPPPSPPTVEGDWLDRWAPDTRPTFVSELSIALLAAAKAGGGLAVLPRYLGDAEPGLTRLPLPQAPTERLWLTVHEDARQAPRVRALIDFLSARLKEDAGLLLGRD